MGRNSTIQQLRDAIEHAAGETLRLADAVERVLSHSPPRSALGQADLAAVEAQLREVAVELSKALRAKRSGLRVPGVGLWPDRWAPGAFWSGT